jgi:methylthioribose-1-phosphate isomerase
MAARGAPDRAATAALGLYVASRRGEFTTVDPTLERMLGRPPINMRDLIAQKAAN